VCSPGEGFNPLEFLLPCGLPVACYLATSVVRSRRPVALPRRGTRALPSPRTFMFLGGMQAAFVPFHSLGPWRARRLDSHGVDGDSRVWLASTRTYIAMAVPFIV